MASQESPLSILDGVQGPGNRRRHVRQKVHSPAYASFDGIAGGMVLDLTEVLNLGEGGMAIQANAALDVNRTLNLVLDLSETKSYVNATGMVVWTGKTGIAGIRFSKMADVPRRQLKEWLFHNALTAAARATGGVPEQNRSLPVQEVLTSSAVPAPKADSAVEPVAPKPLSGPPVLTADAPTLNVIREQVEALGSDVDAALRLLVQHSQALTRASGAAIALAQGVEMVCRASAGDAPPLGTRLHIGSGFSGTCVRTARLQRCDDSDTNPLVDRESCRELGIRSMIAAPIVANNVVIGLLEVFSPAPFSFGEGDATALQRLSEIIGQAVSGSLNVTAEPETVVLPEPRPFWKRQFTRTEIILASLAALLLVAISYVLISWIPRRGFVAPTSPAPQAPAKRVVAQPATPPATLDQWRVLADQGDPMAEFEVGRHYAVGDGVKQDYSEAVKWFTKAAEQGHVRAQGMLGAYYMVGRGVPQDFEQAYFWSVLARAGLDEYSKSRVMFLTSRMTPAQVSQAQQRAEVWIREHQTTASR